MCDKKRVSLLLVLTVWTCRGRCASPVVEVTGGTILGAEESSAQGRHFFAFRAVPYAGFGGEEFRFEPPKPLNPWSGTLSCIEAGPVCAQGALGQVQGEEDCLHLSVYTPKLPGSEKLESLPVLVWLPGGAFVVSGANAYDPTLMMDLDVVLVVPQYRLGIYGFYYAFSEAPGNYGMLDQVAALRWVQDNIQKFGGDPSRVTLAGDCAGGASALYHMISPMSEGLFHRVIAVSGTALAPWAMSHNNHRSMLILTKYLKCPRADTAAMLNCLKKMNVETLLEAQMYLLEARDLFVGNGNFAPAVQAQVIKRENTQFIDEPAVIPFMEGRFQQVPVLLVTSEDVGNYIVDMSLYEWMKFMTEENGKSSEEILSVIIDELGIENDSEEEKLLHDQYFHGLEGKPNDEKLDELGQ
ncbi:Carboxylesterase type B, partial [Trinorchestia longiramus]